MISDRAGSLGLQASATADAKFSIGFIGRTGIHELIVIDEPLRNMIHAGSSEQDEIKFDILFEAMSVLEYDLVNLWEDDFSIAKKLGLTSDMPFDIMFMLGIGYNFNSTHYNITMVIKFITKFITCF